MPRTSYSKSALEYALKVPIHSESVPHRLNLLQGNVDRVGPAEDKGDGGIKT